MNLRTASDTIHHLRPAFWPFIWAHALTGCLLAATGSPLDMGRVWWLRSLVAGGIWAVLLAGAAAGLTSALRPLPGTRNDEGEHTDTPRAVGWASALLLLVGMVLAPMIGWAYLDAYLVGMLLAIVHAVPPIRLGRFAAGSVIIHALGIGALTLFAGYAAHDTGLHAYGAAGPYMAAFALLAVGMRAVKMKGDSKAPVFVYALALLGANAVFVHAGIEAGWRWYAALLGVPQILGWVLLGLARFHPRSRSGDVPGLAVCAWAWFLTDATLALLTMLR